MTASFEITVASESGHPRRVRATPTGVPGLAIHAATTTVGWSLTHVPTGYSAGWWPHGDPEQVLACAQALGRLGDWETADRDRLPQGGLSVVLAWGGSVRAESEGPNCYRSMDPDGSVVITEYQPAGAA